MDVLTAADLDMLKARKTGARPPASAHGAAPAAGGKRYVILTYSGEFDRVHYPLPLAFESPPSTESLLRSVARLRARLAGRAEMQEGLESQPDKDVRQIIAHLRQENTELRHRLRQADSRKLSAPPGQVGMVNELTAANAKLRRTVEGLRKELQEASASFEKQRAESQKELNKWKLRVGAAARDRLEFYSRDAKSRSPSPAVRDALGAGARASAARRDRPWDKTPYVPPFGSGARARSTTPPPLPPVVPGSGGSRGGGVASSSAGSGGVGSRSSAARPRGGGGSTAWSPKSGTSGYTSATAASVAGRSRQSPLGSRANDQSTAGGARRPPVAPRTRSESPNFAPLRRVASSVGGRFDPTLYQQHKAAWQAQAAERPWSAGGRRTSASSTGSNSGARERESGYSSRESDGRRRSASANAASRPSPSSSQPTPRNDASRSPLGSKKRRARRRDKGRAAGRGVPPSDSEGDERPRGAAKARTGRNDWSLLESPAESPVPAASGAYSSSSSAAASSSSAAPQMPFPTVNQVDPPRTKTSGSGGTKPAVAPAAAAPATRPAASAAPSSSSPSRQSISASFDSGGVGSKAKASPRSPARRFVSAVTSEAIRSSKDSGSSQEGTPTGAPQGGGAGLGSSMRSSGEREWAAVRGSGGSSGSRGGQSDAGRAAGLAFGSTLSRGLAGSLGPGSPSKASPGRSKGKGDEEISEIDRRIQVLQSYLDNAR